MKGFLSIIEKVNNYINGIVWGPIMLIFFMFIGIMFTIRLKWFQLINLNLWFKNTVVALFKKKEKSKDVKTISSFQAMTTALAGAIGTGNIVGVATAIYFGCG